MCPASLKSSTRDVSCQAALDDLLGLHDVSEGESGRVEDAGSVGGGDGSGGGDEPDGDESSKMSDSDSDKDDTIVLEHGYGGWRQQHPLHIPVPGPAGIPWVAPHHPLNPYPDPPSSHDRHMG